MFPERLSVFHVAWAAFGKEGMEAVILAGGCKMSRRTFWARDQAIDIINHNPGKGGGIDFHLRIKGGGPRQWKSILRVQRLLL